ncbi:Proteophosphoglycan ppg4 [Rhodotorula toruloides ATCC 204091]|uniref:Proteophosphoglycan ppg4 n=1 Tax=Rhodotorula toruloides TaxID=5286 RepID=A0A0K3CHJ0_RHOTO|nr:Proteophosphoglycan ppg4 [Rhodotorula toruloides ATCC 204091]KAK4331738.1 Proteophosphoglycan ppg4 [Rhodotorula toruloides]PRQ73073.1 Proteophosphoglycan ppg4 [Rhodotorula toruloides]
MSAALSQGLPAGFSLVGGVPLKNPDLAASIVFIVVWALLILLPVWRFAVRRTRVAVLVRPAVVIGIRIATFVIRALEANGNYATGLFIAEQILLLIGLIPLCEPLISLLRFHVRRYWTPSPSDGPKERKTTLNRLLTVLRLALVAAIVLGCVSGAQTNAAMIDPSKVDSLKHYRYAILGITLFISILSPVIALIVSAQNGLPMGPVFFLIGCAACLIIPSVYKLIITLHPVSLVSHGAKAGFYVFSCVPEVVLVVLYFAFDLERMFDINAGVWKDKVKKKMRKGKWVGAYTAQEEYEMREVPDQRMVRSGSDLEEGKS